MSWRNRDPYGDSLTAQGLIIVGGAVLFSHVLFPLLWWQMGGKNQNQIPDNYRVITYTPTPTPTPFLRGTPLLPATPTLSPTQETVVPAEEPATEPQSTRSPAPTPSVGATPTLTSTATLETSEPGDAELLPTSTPRTSGQGFGF